MNAKKDRYRVRTIGGNVNALLAFSRLVDRANDVIGKAMTWLILVVVVISAGNAVVRYAIDWSSNAFLEIQWYLFSAIFLLCAGYVLNKNEHIRIDIIAGRFSARTQNWIDVFGFIVFFAPITSGRPATGNARGRRSPSASRPGRPASTAPCARPAPGRSP